MSQHDFNIANQGFPAFRSDLNNALTALASNSSGDTPPSTTYANQFWYETDTNTLYFRNEDNDAWITLAVFDQTNDEWEVRTGVIQAVDSAGVVIKTDDGVARISVADDGTVTIGSVDINGGTIDGVTIGGSSAPTVTDIDINGGTIDGTTIGGASAGAGTFTTLDGSSLDIDSGATAQSGLFESSATTAYSPTSYNGGSARLFLRGGNATNSFTAFNFTHGGSFEALFGAVQNSSGTADFVFQGYNGSSYSERARIDASDNLQFNSGFGSVATAYGCRAWVNFNGTGTVAIRASGNVSSITDNATGDYTVNFTIAMPDANYSVAGMSSADSTGYGDTGAVAFRVRQSSAPTTNGVRVTNSGGGASILDAIYGNISIFR